MIFRCFARLYLLHVHKLHILEAPPIQPLNRKTLSLKSNDVLNNVITLPSGRTIRKLDNGKLLYSLFTTIFICHTIHEYYFLNFISAPPMNRRTWEAPPRVDRLNSSGKTLIDRYIVAEVRKIIIIIVVIILCFMVYLINFKNI